MKLKNIIGISIFSLGMLTFTGCFGEKKIVPNELKCNINGQKVPNWVCNPKLSLDGYKINALGSAKSNGNEDFDLLKDEAEMSARDRIARKLSIRIKNMLRKYKSVSGIGKDATYDKFFENVSKHIVNQTLVMSEPYKLYMTKDRKYLFVLVGIKNPDKSIMKIINTSYKNDRALWEKYLGEKGFKKLEEEIKNMKDD